MPNTEKPTAPVASIYMQQFQWHRKPAGWTGAPCPVCGCEAPRLRAEHRALPADESWQKHALWEKRFKVCFGLDFAVEPIRTES